MHMLAGLVESKCEVRSGKREILHGACNTVIYCGIIHFIRSISSRGTFVVRWGPIRLAIKLRSPTKEILGILGLREKQTSCCVSNFYMPRKW